MSSLHPTSIQGKGQIHYGVLPATVIVMETAKTLECTPLLLIRPHTLLQQMALASFYASNLARAILIDPAHYPGLDKLDLKKTQFDEVYRIEHYPAFLESGRFHQISLCKITHGLLYSNERQG
jgi:hypothetical protein